MSKKGSLSKDTFLRIAEDSGLDTHSPHLEDLYAYLQGLRPILQTVENLDLSDLEPFMPSFTKKEPLS